MRLLENRVAVVTGATRGIGLAIARTSASHGASLVVADTNLRAVLAVKAHVEVQGDTGSSSPGNQEARGRNPRGDAMTTIEREILSAPAEIAIPPTLTPGEQKPAVMTPHQRYRQGIEGIWQKVDQLPEGQDIVVLSQLWELGKTSAIPTPTRFPALAAHGFITEQLTEHPSVWKPYSPYLKDFWRIGIAVSQASGFRLRPHQAFEANLRAAMAYEYPVLPQERRAIDAC
jgi:short chain dehydrogenase